MPMAFVLINTEMGAESEVLKALDKLTDVKEAYVVYGVYDVIVKVESETMEKLKSVITWNIRRLNKVRSTLTMMAAEDS
ncbi:MAG: Lrp/AsnC ligand binding domain-containing protein [Candidatus Bathyarchaeota archaeon]|nr:MAG: Lrp/AsnC ligand binding domain-containing protein [Candidatus Bathyarchaeota archaeon]